VVISQSGLAVYPPKTAILLGILGVLPFVALTVLSWIADEAAGSAAFFAVVAYGAVILSFLGGAHWGLASGRIEDQPAAASRLLIFSVVPSLVGWAALLVPAPWSAAVLAVAFVAVLTLDRSAAKRSLAPDWWLCLRTPLSATVAVLLLLTFVSVLMRFGS